MGESIKNKKIILCLAILGVLIAVPTVLAVDWPPSPGFNTILDPASSELSDLIKYFYEWAVTLGGLAVFIVLVYAGFQYLTSVGDPGKMKDAMDRIKSAFLGLVLLLGSVLILNTINPELTTFRTLEMPSPETLGNCEKVWTCKDKNGIEFECTGDKYCENNFGEGFKCVNNTCALDLEDLFEVKYCTSVDVIVGLEEKEGGEEKKHIFLKLGETFQTATKAFKTQEEPPIMPQTISYKAEPAGCMGYLDFYEGTSFWGGCAGVYQRIGIQPTKTYYKKDGGGEAEEVSALLEIKSICIELVKPN